MIDDEIASREGEEREKEVSANLHLAQKALGELKYSEAIAAAQKVLAADPDNAKAKEIIAASEQKLEEGQAAEKEVTSTPAPPRQVETPAKAPAPAASAASAASGVSEVEKIRNEAMELFNAEEYAKAEEAWKKLLEMAPDDKQAQEMLETTQMLIEALK